MSLRSLFQIFFAMLVATKTYIPDQGPKEKIHSIIFSVFNC